MSPAQRYTSLHLLSAFVLIAAIALLVTPASSWAALPGANGQIAFTSDRNGNWEIYTTKLDGSPDKRLTTSTAMNSEPSWSPDGSKIAFSVVEPTFSNVYVMNGAKASLVRVICVRK